MTSKEIEELKKENKKLKQEVFMFQDMYKSESNRSNIYYLRLEKLEKVVDIIKNKQVVIFALFHSDSASEYNFMRNEKYYLTQEEFELLKEVFVNE